MESLKEWAAVVKALENGDQTVLLRKGGILEIASGFKIESQKFLLFPTFEHQKLGYVKPQYQDYLKHVKKNHPKEGFNTISSFAQVAMEADIFSKEKINALSPFHIWSNSYINERRDWMPEKPMKAIFLKVNKIPEFEIPLKSEYHGCKSWIDINSDIEAGTLVLSDSEFDSRLKKFKEIVN